MASISSSHDEETPDIESTKSTVAFITDHIHTLISNPSSWSSLKSTSTARLTNIVKKNQENHFDFSEHSVISNLYWGIEAIESAMQGLGVDGRADGLKKAESMLQVPALLEEDGVTAGIHNHYLICCSYFFLSVVKKLQNDDWQVALHFFQALMVSPSIVRLELAPRVFEDLFREPCNDEDVRRMARRYKHRLMYYQVMLYGEVGRDYVHHKAHSFRQLLSWRNDPLETYCNKLVQYEKVHPLDSKSYEIVEVDDYQPRKLDVKKEMFSKDRSTRSLQEVLMESESDTETTSISSCCNYHVEEGGDHVEESINEGSVRCTKGSEDNQLSLASSCEYRSLPFLINGEKPKFTSGRLVCSTGLRDRKIDSLLSCYEEDDHHERITMDDLRRSMVGKNENKRKTKKQKKNLHTRRDFRSQLSQHQNGQGSETELVLLLEKAISRLCFSEEEEEEEYDYAIEVTTIYEMLSKKRGVKYNMLKNAILDQLLVAISTSKEERVIRASVSILSTIVLVNNSAVEDIKRKGLSLYNLATALKQKVHEAAILIYLINPSPTEIKTLELLPALVEVVCTCSKPMLTTTTMRSCQLVLTPPAASLMIMEVLVTAFDCDTNNVHLEAINSPQVLGRLVEVAKVGSLDEQVVSLARILVKCMQFGGDCRRYISESVSLDAFTRLLQRREKRAKLAALEFFQEILCIPRSSATSLLPRIQKGLVGSSNLMQILLDCMHDIETDHKVLAANLLLQLDTLEDSSSESMFAEEALQVILNGLSNEQSSTSQQLSAFILANIGGTYAWNGEPYTSAWLVKKGGLTSLTHRNLVKNFNQLDHTLQDTGIDPWCAKITKRVMDLGKPVFQALACGLISKIKRVRLNSLTAIAWIGCEIGKYPNNLRYSACEILLTGLEQFLHPGMELEHRFLACMCIYNYASGKGMQRLIHFSEGVRESLRRFSSVTWMAEELHRVADYYLPNRSRISCVHTQVLEAKHSCSGAVTALIYYKGLLFSGYSDGSIKVWEIKDQTASLALERKEHRKAVTCFSLLEHGESLLSGSADKTIRVWKMVQRKLECIEVISANESIRKLETYGHMVFAITQSHGIKVFDSSRTAKDICKSKKAKSMTTSIQGKIYVGCMDASIQEFSITSNREREIKAPVKNWMMQSKPINSMVVYKDWLYTAGSLVEGSKVKEWRTNCRPQVSMVAEKGKSVVAMEVVEDFIYLNCSSSTSSLQIWLRGTQQKVGRISAGSRITSLLCANDIVLCGTEKGLIKGWIPL